MSSESKERVITVCSDVREIPASKWNALVNGQYPFLNHGFLTALEKHGCVGDASGWIPRHLAYFDQDILVGAMPLYEKHNSWGEFVFDHAWADAYERYGMHYYPKLINAIPFTPATGQRILMRHENPHEIVDILLTAANQFAEQGNYSGVHSLFPSSHDFDLMNSRQAVFRNDCQFHWHNRDYSDFEAFLSTLKAKKRKNIRQERRKVADQGVRIKKLNGNTASEQDWIAFTDLYQKIYDRKYGMPAFNLAFFMEVAAAMPEQILLVLAHNESRCLAGALMYLDQETLYGRHWGCDQYIDSLHFELCYYQGIEFCIENNLKRFDPGAQGEHKIARGFVPTRTRSLHWMVPGPFNDAIRQFVQREEQGVSRYMDLAQAHSPYNHQPL